MALLFHELRRLAIRPRTWIGFGVFLALEIIFFAMLRHPEVQQAFSRLLTSNGLDDTRYARGMTLALMSVMFTFVMIGSLYITLVSGDIVAKETEEGTMRLILARPVSRQRMLLAKIFACTLHTTLLVVFMTGTSLLLARLFSGAWGGLFFFMPEAKVVAFHDGAEAWKHLLIAFTLLALNAQLISALAFFFSCCNIKAAAATILALSCLFIDFVLAQMPWFESFHVFFLSWNFDAWRRALWDPAPWALIGRSECLLVGLTLAFYALGVARFCSRDLKS